MIFKSSLTKLKLNHIGVNVRPSMQVRTV